MTSGDPARLSAFAQVMTDSVFGVHADGIRIPDAVVARRIGKIIKRLTKNRLPLLWSYYDRLSELAHPNYYGMMGSYAVVGEPHTVF